MNRNVAKCALVLSVRQSAQDNRVVCLLTKDGIEFSTLFGGAKSRLSPAVSPWNSGTMYFYNNAEKRSSKITDFDVKKYHSTFRESLFKSFAAALAGEIVTKSNCGGSSEEAFVLLNGFLDGLDLCGEDEGRLGLLRFLWRYMGVLGVRPDASRCVRCGREFTAGGTIDGADGTSNSDNASGLDELDEINGTRNFSSDMIQSKTSGNYPNEVVLYSPSEGGFVCKSCSGEEGSGKFRHLSIEALFYLEAAGGQNLARARSLSLSKSGFDILKAFLYEAIEDALGLRLKTLSSGRGIL